MTIGRNNRNDYFDSNSGNSKSPFQEHNERMREFRSSHADVVLMNGQRLDKAGLLETTEPLRLRYPIGETGGARLLGGIIDWSELVPMLKVTRYKLSQS